MSLGGTVSPKVSRLLGVQNDSPRGVPFTCTLTNPEPTTPPWKLLPLLDSYTAGHYLPIGNTPGPDGTSTPQSLLKLFTQARSKPA